MPAIVGADILDRVILAVEIEHRDLRTVHVDHLPLPGRKLVVPRTVTQSLMVQQSGTVDD